jgi:acetolactate decarboxylase
MKKAILTLALMFCLLIVIGTACSADDNQDIIFQTSPIIALQQGDFDGAYKCGDLKQHGDYGLGTFDHLDGEMIMVEDKIYQIKIDGVAYEVSDSEETPFAVVTFFQPEKTTHIDNADSYAHLQQQLDASLPTENTFYAIKIEGTFDYIKVRSVPKQSKPYPTLEEAAAKQAVFELYNVQGTIFGFRSPPYIGSLNVPGYHFHLITADRTAGGHILDCRVSNIIAEIDETGDYQLVIPTTGDFTSMEFATPENPSLDKVEK